MPDRPPALSAWSVASIFIAAVSCLVLLVRFLPMMNLLPRGTTAEGEGAIAVGMAILLTGLAIAGPGTLLSLCCAVAGLFKKATRGKVAWLAVAVSFLPCVLFVLLMFSIRRRSW
jgi:hypothetical protein